MNKTTLGDKFREKYPNQIPIIVHYTSDVKFLNNTVPKKSSQLLVSGDTILGDLDMAIRRHGKIPHNEPLTIKINRLVNVLNSLDVLSDSYTKNKNIDDGCLHIYVEKDAN